MSIIRSSFIIICLFLYSCEPSDTVVGTESDTEIPSLSFLVDTTYVDLSSSRLVAKGAVINYNNGKVSSPWYVEGQFFTDGTKRTKLGGSNTQIGVPLSKGQSTFWTLYFTSTNVDVTKYPNFKIGELRGIYK